MKHRTAGNRGNAIEQLACRWLQDRGLELVKRNYRCKVGEIDLLMLERDTLVFVEVRFRRQSRYGSGVESVDRRKQRKLALAANHFLVTHRRYASQPCRFDVLAASPVDGCQEQLQWIWIKAAFGDV